MSNTPSDPPTPLPSLLCGLDATILAKLANAFTQGRLPVGEFDFLAFLPSGEFDIVRHRRPRQQGGRDNSMSSHSIHTKSNSALHDAPRASATVGLFDQAMVTAVVIAIAYIASIMVGWL
jgi:hypothetical protein